MNAQTVKVKKKNSLEKRLLKWGGGFLLLALIAFAFMPRNGTEKYGLCKVFLELNIPYPLTLRILQVEEVGNRADIIYSDMDGFGYDTISRLRCQFSTLSNGNIVLKDYQFDDYKRPLEKKNKDIADFNRSIPTLMQNLPSLALPTPLPDNITDLKTSE